MATYLFTTIGTQDIQFKKEFINECEKRYCLIDGKGLSGSARDSGLNILNDINNCREKLDYPILQPLIDYCVKREQKIDEIFLIVSNQKKPHPLDTLYFGMILEKLIWGEFGINTRIVEIQGNISSFDDQYFELNDCLKEIENEQFFNNENDKFYILSQSGAPPSRNALLLNCMQRFKGSIQIEKPKNGEVTVQHFPEHFFKQVKEKIAPYAIKAYVAQVLSKNYVHHIGSHVSNRVFFNRLFERFKINQEDLLIGNQVFHNAVQERFQEVKTDLPYIVASEVFWELNENVTNTIETLRYMLVLKDKLDAYCQQRNEYIANLTASPDLSGKTAFLFRDILVPFIENTLILDNIAASEKFCYSNKQDEKQISLQVFIKRSGGDYHKMEIEYLKADKSICTDLYKLQYNEDGKIIAPTIETKSIPDKRFDGSVFNLKTIKSVNIKTGLEVFGSDIEITLPGTLGSHSMYSILENYIRNVAKHDRALISNELQIKLFIEEENENYYYVYLTNPDSILDNTQTNKIKTHADKAFELIDSNSSEPVQSGSGILDMAINATLLKGEGNFNEAILKGSLQIGRTGIEKSFPDIPVEVLYYGFQLRKAKNVVCLTSTDIPEDVQSGITFTENFMDVMGGKFAVIDYNLIKAFKADEVDKLLLKLPFRVIIVIPQSADLVESHLGFSMNRQVITCTSKELPIDKNLTLEKCWQVWFLKHWGNKVDWPLAQLYLYFEDSGMKSKWPENVKLGNQSFIDLTIEDVGIKTLKQPVENLPLVCFDHHGTLHQKFSKPCKVLFNRSNNYVLFGKNSADYSKIAHAWNNPNMVFELTEAGLLNVLVVDERIAQISMKTEEIDKPQLTNREDIGFLWDFYQAANVWVCTRWNFKSDTEKDISVDFIQETPKTGFSDTPFLKVVVDASKDKFSIGYECPGNCTLPNRFDMIILHRTVLTDMIGNLESEIFIDQLHCHFPYVIVNSGAGRPMKVKGNYKFLPYATLSKYFGLKEFAKYSFIQELMEI